MLFQHVNSSRQSPAQSVAPRFVDEQGAPYQLPKLFFDSLQRGKIQPVKILYQSDLLLMAGLKRLAYRFGIRPYHGRRFIEPERGSAVIDGRGPQVFQRIGIPDHSEIILMPVLIDDQIIQDQHPIQRLLHSAISGIFGFSRRSGNVGDSRNPQRLTAVQIMPVYRNMIWLPTSPHDVPGADQLRIRRDKIVAYAVGIAVFHQQPIGNMRNIQPFHQSGRKRFIVRLLLHSPAPALDQAALSIRQDPSLFQPAVRGIVRRHQTDRSRIHISSKQNLSHIPGKRILEKIDLLPAKLTFFRTDPVLIGQAEAEAFFQQELRLRNFHPGQRFLQSRSAGRDRPAAPPCV